MFGIKTELKSTPKKVNDAVDKAAYRSFAHAAASIRVSAIESIEVSNEPGPPGGPIRTKIGRRKKKGKGRTQRGGKLAQRSILFKADKHDAVIGFAASKIDQAMQFHEHGGVRGGIRLPARPTISPALQRNLARFHREWKGAI